MSVARRCRWAGWGRDEQALRLDDQPGLVAFLREALGDLPVPTPPRSMETIEVGPSRVPDDVLARLADLLGTQHVRTDRNERLLHSLGKSYPDLICARTGRIRCVTDAVLYPETAEQVAGVLRTAAEHSLAVVPFGGGTSVVGGLEPKAGEHRGVLTLDLSRMVAVKLDSESLLADVEAGIFGPDLEARLARDGLTLGHFPQSFEFSTLGGWIATRGAGQNSTRYGKIEQLVQAVRLVTPAGEIETRNVPASATGPSTLQAIVGSEGTLGVITSAVVRVRRLPETTRWMAWLSEDFWSGCRLLQTLEQEGLPISVARLSDAEETRWMSKAGNRGDASLVARVGKWYVQRSLERRGYDPQRVCFALVSLEGRATEVREAAARAKAIARRLGSVALGSSPGRAWQRDRFRLPYLRDELIARRVMVDTLETATTWSNLRPLYQAIRVALSQSMQQNGSPGVVMCHLSHLYASGSSLYFTFLAPQIEGSELLQWQRVKQAALRAIVKGGGALSHHHGIGQDHLPLAAEDGPLAVEAWRAAKMRLDPTGIMNPGKLLAEPPNTTAP